MTTRQDKPVKLSKRMKQLLAMLEKGMSNKAIAQELGLSEHTVKVHCWRLFIRIGVHSRTQAAKWWNTHQPANIQFALREAFDAACRLHDQLMVDGGDVYPAEFAHHRNMVNKLTQQGQGHGHD
jgi:DNA-binding CsgD family transcriptional regulator